MACSWLECVLKLLMSCNSYEPENRPHLPVGLCPLIMSYHFAFFAALLAFNWFFFSKCHVSRETLKPPEITNKLMFQGGIGFVCVCAGGFIGTGSSAKHGCFIFENEIWLGGNVFQSSPNEKLSSWETSGTVHRLWCGERWQVPLDVLFSAEIIESQIPSWLRASGLYSGGMHAPKPVKLCQRMNPSSVCLPCCRVSFVSGLIVAREEFLHLPAHAYMHGLYFFPTLRPFLSLFASATFYQQTPAHADLLYTTTSLLCSIWKYCWL